MPADGEAADRAADPSPPVLLHEETRQPPGPSRPDRPSRRPSRGELLALLGTQLRQAIRESERQAGRVVDRAALARRVNVSRNSVYAYLDGRRLPSAVVLDALLLDLGATPAERRRLAELRDLIADHRHRGGKSSAAVVPTVADDGAPVDEAPVDEAPIGETPVDETPIDEAPIGGAPVDEAPIDETPVGSAADGVPGGPATGELADRPAGTDHGPPDVEPGGRRRLPGRRRSVLVLGLCLCLAVTGAGLGWSWWRSTQPAVIAAKGPSAVGRPGHTGKICTDPSCAYVRIELRNYRPNHTYLVRCRSDGGMDPLENRDGYSTVRVSTDARGHALLDGDATCLWGYQATHVWVTVEADDGIPELSSNLVAW